MSVKKVKIFISIGEEELEKDRDEIGNFIRTLNDIYKPYGLYFVLLSDDNMDNFSEDDIKESELFLILFHKNIDERSKKEFDFAYKLFTSKDIKGPQLVTYVKEDDEEHGESVLEFMRYLDQDLKHFYNKYESTDKIILYIVLKLQNLGFKQIQMDIKDGKMLLNEQEVITLDKIPMFFNNRQLSQLKEEVAKIDDKIWSLKKQRIENPDDEELTEKYLEEKEKLAQAKKQIYELEKNILNLESSFIKIQAEQSLTKRQIRAKELLDSGYLDEALEELSLKEITQEANDLLKLQEERKKEIQTKVNELTQRADTLKLDLNNENRFKEIEETYEEAIRIEKEAGLERKTEYTYGDYLKWQGKPDRAITYLLDYFKYSKENGYQMTPGIYNIIGITYMDLDMLDESEQFLLDYINVDKDKRIEEDEDNYYSCAAIGYMNLSSMHREYYKREYKKSLDYALKSVEISEKLYQKDPNNYEYEMVHSLKHTAESYMSMSYYAKAKDYFERQVKLMLASNKDYESDIARAYMRIGRLCYLWNEEKFNYDNAIKFTLNAIEKYRTLVDKNREMYTGSLSTAVFQLGEIYHDLKDYENAEKYFLEDIQLDKYLYESISDNYKSDLAITYKNLGDVYLDQEKFEKSRIYFSKAFEIYMQLYDGQPEVYDIQVASTSNFLGIVYEDLKDFPKAAEYYQHAIDYIKQRAEKDEKIKQNRYNIYVNNLNRLREKMDVNDLLSGMGVYIPGLDE